MVPGLVGTTPPVLTPPLGLVGEGIFVGTPWEASVAGGSKSVVMSIVEEAAGLVGTLGLVGEAEADVVVSGWDVVGAFVGIPKVVLPVSLPKHTKQ